jgi:hypothetical protein
MREGKLRRDAHAADRRRLLPAHADSRYLPGEPVYRIGDPARGQIKSNIPI